MGTHVPSAGVTEMLLMVSEVPTEVRLDAVTPELSVVPVRVPAGAVPVMLIPAVPVRLVTVPLEGVPNAPPLTTNAPDEPVLTPKAVTTPVPVVTVAGVAPAPPPTTKALAAKAAEDAQVDALEKYGMPPEVPATVNAGVVVGLATVMMPPVKLTVVTVPPDAVEARVPATNVNPVPTVTFENPPAELPYKMLLPLVAGA